MKKIYKKKEVEVVAEIEPVVEPKPYWQKLQDGDYESKLKVLPYPHKEPKDSLLMETYKISLERFYEDQHRLEEEFWKDIEDFYGVSNNPKKNKLRAVSYQIGHSSGFSEIASYYSELVDLIK